VGGLWFAWGMKWRIGQWWCMMKQMGDGNLRSLMKHDELGDMGHLVPMRYDVYYKHMPHFLKMAYRYKAILNLQN
jgi:hypothetical protein